MVGGLGVAATLGCGGPAAVKSPPLDIAGAARQAITDYDTNGDGALDPEDFAENPFVGWAIVEVDSDRDNKITEKELAARMRSWRRGKGVSAQQLRAHVTFRGAPLPGVVVTLAPLPMMGDGFVAATGETDAEGFTALAIPAENRPEGSEDLEIMWGGFYRVSVSPGANKRARIPQAWQDGTVDGVEVGATSRLRGGALEIDVSREGPR